VWTALVLMTSLTAGFVIIALFMAGNHAWTDAITAALPVPGPATSLAADPGLSSQIRITRSRAWYTTLADQTPTLIAQATVVNDALLPVSNILVEGQAYRDGKAVRSALGVCGRPISNRLIRRLPRDELRALQRLQPPTPTAMVSGSSMECQLAFAGIKPGATEVSLRIASVEPLPGHRSPLFHPEE